jgi:hypothetical protein
MAKIKINLTDKFIEAFPEAEKIKVLPRKKKKALKKKFSKMIIDLLNYESHEIFSNLLEEKIFEEAFEKVEEALRNLETRVNKI